MITGPEASWNFLYSYMSSKPLSYCCFLFTQSCPTLWDPMDCTMPGFQVLHHLLKLAQIHVHWVNDAMQPYHPLSSPSSLAFNLLKSGGKSIGASAPTSVLPMNSQDWFYLAWLVWSPSSPRDSWVFSNTTVQKYQFFSTQPSLWFNSHIYTRPLEKT